MGHPPTRRPGRPAPLAAGAVLAAAALPWAGCAGGGGADTSIVADLVDAAAAPTPGEAARDAFDTYDADARRRAVSRLAGAPFGGEAPYLKLYRLLLDDPDPTVRAAAIRALAQHGQPRDAPAIAATLEDENDFLQWEAAKALQRLHHPEVVGALIRVVVEADDVDVRMAAARALGQYPQPRVFDVLVGALDDVDYGVVQAAADSLRTLTGRDFGRDGRAWLAWGRAHRQSLFDQGGVFTYRPYAQPPGVLDRLILDRVMFWRGKEPPESRVPAGLDAS